jgi:VanZ family protein
MKQPKIVNILKRFPLGWLCVLNLAAILIAGLWPFTPFPKNRVEWLPSDNGIRFDGRGLVYGLENSLEAAPQWQGGNTLTVELWLKPEREPDRNLPVFLTIYDRHNLEAVTIGQWRSGLVVRWKNLDTPLDFKEFGIRDVLGAGERRLLAVTFDRLRCAVFVDGRLKREYAKSPLASLDGDSTRFVLGNSPNGRDAWAGDLFAFALYDRSLSAEEVSRNYDGWVRTGFPVVSAQDGLVGLFTFRERSGDRAANQLAPDDYFRIPRYFQPLQREMLTPPWKDFQFNRSYVLDMLINFLGFVPFGVFFTAWSSRSLDLSRHRAAWCTVVVAAVLSCGIELLQAWIPLRDSQMMDLLMNTVGATLGALAFARSRGRPGRSSCHTGRGRDQSTDQPGRRAHRSVPAGGQAGGT